LPCTTDAMLLVIASNNWANVGEGGMGSTVTGVKGRRNAQVCCVGADVRPLRSFV
jgi:hypothetical protein